ncbi:type II toxin-antitoxin system VapB family antitoxin [Acidobacteria bacterium AH-259-A15]|nr:type II toxin-antitoxin system VapB family antitoxin [Acidobacteria bacterium AH-259-A15]
MARLSVSIDSELLEQAKEVAGVRTKRETIERALREFVLRHRLSELEDLAGSDLVDMDLDELRRLRALGLEEPR